MPRPARLWIPGQPYHVIARASGGQQLFAAAADYAGFLALFGAAQARSPAPALGWCLMPNHVHLVLRAGEAGLSGFMQWLLTRHAAGRNRADGGRGSLWQPRFRAFAIQEEREHRHLLAVLRYVERNALRGRLVARAEDWPWGSLPARLGPARPPVWFEALQLPAGWRDWVNAPQTAAEVAALRASVNRGLPFGGAEWAEATARRHGLGRPRRGPPRLGV